ncbi:MAG: ATP synthase F1 subunit epsilon [Thermaerobacter sp.]|nr:ATP synthase F1 subunit epsilon [Thermaerobacter sp.]
MATTFALSVVTPEREALRTDAEMIIVRGADGDLGVLARHIPLVTAIQPSVLVIKTADGEQQLAVTGGFLEVRGDVVTVLARTAERPDEIDRRRAEEAKQRAEERLQERLADLEEGRAKLALQRASVRLQLVEDGSRTAV